LLQKVLAHHHVFYLILKHKIDLFDYCDEDVHKRVARVMVCTMKEESTDNFKDLGLEKMVRCSL
jgi:hypothetical protein